MADVNCRKEGAIGRLTLDRPKALNALTRDMCVEMKRALDSWAHDEAVKAVVIDAVPGRAFCAGGDIRALFDDPKNYAPQFYANEYRLNAAIKHCKKPYVALIDGICMGGGVGVSVHGSHRVVSENATFAMPETAIGFFPDIGGSFFLPRLKGELGTYLALTGARLKAADLIYAGISTHFVQAEQMTSLAENLAAGDAMDKVLGEKSNIPGEPTLKSYQAAIDRAFAFDSVETILDALEHEGEWGGETANTIRSKSPIALKVTLREMREGKKLGFDDCMRMEYRLALRAVASHDFRAGVRAAVIDKNQAPVWNPPALDLVGEADVAAYFAPLGAQELSL
ncbi:MAG: enoyl-CoA hydratase/isomerase family protein [Alphaproteobacteria bacterium]